MFAYISMLNFKFLFRLSIVPVSWFKQFTIYIIWGCLYSNNTNWSSVVLFFKHFPIYFSVKLSIPLGIPVLVRKSQFQQFIIYIIWGRLHSDISKMHCSSWVEFSAYFFVKLEPLLWLNTDPDDTI